LALASALAALAFAVVGSSPWRKARQGASALALQGLATASFLDPDLERDGEQPQQQQQQQQQEPPLEERGHVDGEGLRHKPKHHTYGGIFDFKSPAKPATTTTARATSAPSSETASATSGPQTAQPARQGTMAGKPLLKGIGYAPVPMNSSGLQRFGPSGDFMSKGSSKLWGRHPGRGDLRVMRELGVNTVRLYGNDASAHHGPFLDEATAQNLDVIIGLDDGVAGGCVHTDFNCYARVKEHYISNLLRGFVQSSGKYHPALKTLVLVNEVDLKLGHKLGSSALRHFCRVVISALDAVIDAEKEVGARGPLPNITASVSFQKCLACQQQHLRDVPALGHMDELRHAMQRPESVGYHSQNDLWAAYQARFENSISAGGSIASEHSQGSAVAFRESFLGAYGTTFSEVPVFIGEYSPVPGAEPQQDLEAMMGLAADESILLKGIVLAAFQAAPQGKDEHSFSLFNLGVPEADAPCLVPTRLPLMKKEACGLVEDGVNYNVEDTWVVNVDAVPNAGACCAKCSGYEGCKAWTWIDDKDFDGCEKHADAGAGTAMTPCCKVHSANADGQTCGARIKNLAASMQVTVSLARREVAAVYPKVCGACGEGHGRCWLKGAAPKGKRSRVVGDGFVSGLPAGTRQTAPFLYEAVAKAFEGAGVDARQFCPASLTSTMA